MLSVINEQFILSVALLNFSMGSVVNLNVTMLNVIMLNVIMLNVIMLDVIMLNVIMLSVLAPFYYCISLITLERTSLQKECVS